MKCIERSGFTLIELLIVVAIIAILAAIAVPNFLEAQTRSKISRVKADMRAISVAVEAYHIDENKYPVFSLQPKTFSVPGGGNGPSAPEPLRSKSGLSTPIAYISSVPNDPFGEVFDDDDYRFNGTATISDGYYYNTRKWFQFYNYNWAVYPGNQESNPAEWVLQSKGPNKYFSKSSLSKIPGAEELDRPYKWQYDPTNGTISHGNIVISGP